MSTPGRMTLIGLFVLAGGCSPASIDSAAVRAKSGVPESARVDQISIPYDSASPRYALCVEPLRITEHVTSVAGGTSGQALNQSFEVIISKEQCRERQEQIAAQLTSALAGVGNFSLFAPRSGGCGRVKARAGLRGPFTVSAQITEYESRSEERSSGSYWFFGSEKENFVVGSVGLDVTVTEVSSGRISAAFPVHASFSRQSQKTTQGLIFPMAEQRQSAQSVLDQALRVALNDAAQRTFEELSGSAR